jgi:hypothetical protein
MIDIVDKFGGNFAAVEKAAIKSDEARDYADSLYFSGDYASSLEAYDSAIAKLTSSIDQGRKIAKQALFYVYLIEWTGVSGTLMVCGVFLYMVMIRRRMYAEVEITRLRERVD